MKSKGRLERTAATGGGDAPAFGAEPSRTTTAGALDGACCNDAAPGAAAFERQLKDALTVEVPADLASRLLSVAGPRRFEGRRRPGRRLEPRPVPLPPSAAVCYCCLRMLPRRRFRLPAVWSLTAVEGAAMSDHVYKKIELTGSSSKGSDDAIRNAVAKAGDSLENLDWFEVTETRGYIEKGQVTYWQVTIKVGFRLK